jgi:hypothetical protein
MHEGHCHQATSVVRIARRSVAGSGTQERWLLRDCASAPSVSKPAVCIQLLQPGQGACFEPSPMQGLPGLPACLAAGLCWPCPACLSHLIALASAPHRPSLSSLSLCPSLFSPGPSSISPFPLPSLFLPDRPSLSSATQLLLLHLLPAPLLCTSLQLTAYPPPNLLLCEHASPVAPIPKLSTHTLA